MVVKVFISGISGSKEVKKRQQRVLMILDSRNFKYEIVDIAEPGNEGDKDFMHSNSKSMGATVADATPRHALPPQIFNDSEYCGDYDHFDLCNENDELEKFLKLEVDDSVETVTSSAEVQLESNDAVTSNSKENDDVEMEAESESNEAQAVEENNEAEAAQTETTNGNIPTENGDAEALEA